MGKADSNRRNAQKSTGPHDTTSTRHNAVKHGLLARGITELDDSEAYESLVQRLIESHHPVGDLEKFFVQRIAFHVIRLQRAEKLEAECITQEILSNNITNPGLPAAVGAVGDMNLVSGIQRYETAIENKLYRAINQLERLQRMRRGEFVPAPESLDVSINSGRARKA